MGWPRPATDVSRSRSGEALTPPPPPLQPRPGPGASGREIYPAWALALLALWVGLLLGHAVGLYRVPLLTQADRWLYDLRLRALAPTQADPQIVLVDIDERALAAQGRWPWNRSGLAELLAKVADDGGARLIGLDLILAEPDASDGLAALRRQAQRAPGNATLQAAVASLAAEPDDDQQLAAVLARAPVVLGFHLSNEAGAARIGSLPTPIAPLPVLGPASRSLPSWIGHGGNLPLLQASAGLGAGHLNAFVDGDGLVRQVPLLIQHEGQLHGTLALAMARAVVGQNPQAHPRPGLARGLASLSFEPADGPLRALVLRAASSARASGSPPTYLRLPVGEAARAWVPYSAAGSSFVRLSAADVMANLLPPNALRDKLVIVGVSAPGLIDQRPTPVDEAMLGSLVHAHLLAGMLGQRLLATPAAAPVIDALALLAVAGLLWWRLPGRLLWQGAAWTAGVLAAVALATTAAWALGGWVMPLASLVLLPPTLLLGHGLLAYRHATGAQQELAALFGQYVPPELVARMGREPGRYSMRSRSTELTVLFADVHGFSGLAEHMPPAELGEMMNLIFSHLTDVIREHRGTLDKYIGDSVMAFWGAPLDDPGHARHAVAAALAMRRRLPTLHAAMATRGWPPLDINVGINTGHMVVGDMGSRHRRAYTVMGDAVNLAARVQALCSQFGLGLVVGDDTRKALGDTLCLALGHIKVRGRDAPIRVWHPLGFTAGKDPHADLFSREWARMRLAVEAGRTEQAHALLDALQANLSLQPLCRWQRRQLLSGQSAEITLHPSH